MTKLYSANVSANKIILCETVDSWIMVGPLGIACHEDNTMIFHDDLAEEGLGCVMTKQGAVNLETFNA